MISESTLNLELPAPAPVRSSDLFGVIYCDPPWRYDDKLGNSAAWGAMKYPTMSVEEICALPVKQHAAKDCALLMWATWPLLPEAMRVIEAWGFKYRTCAFVWVKQNPNADNGWLIRQDLKDALDGYSGLGKWVNGNTEICLLAKRGSPKRQAKNVKQLVIAPRSRHSAKPPEVRDRIVQLFGDVPRLEMFARSKTPGWSIWGNELENDVAMTSNAKLSDDAHRNHTLAIAARRRHSLQRWVSTPVRDSK